MTEAIGRLFVINCVTTAAILLVAAIRGPLRRTFGAQAAYAAWMVAPAGALACLLPRGALPLPLPLPDPLRQAGLATLAQSAAPASTRLRLVLATVWIAGALVTAALLAWRQAAYLSSLGPLTPVGEDKRRLRAQRLGIGPAVIGFLRPRIITAADFEQAFDPREQTLILAHEHVHLRRGDSVVNAFVAAARCVLWFNPLLHWAAHLVRVDQEFACDAAVLERFPAQRRAYGELLLKSQSGAPAVPIGCQWPAHPGPLLRQRIVLLKAAVPKTRTAAGLAVAALMAAAVGSATWAADQEANLAGTWSFSGDISTPAGRAAGAKPQCTFTQAGERLTGQCRGPNSAGPVTGAIKGRHVSWRWRFRPYTKAGLGGVSAFDGEIEPDKAMHGTWSYSGLPGATGRFSGRRQ
ncbi:MAG TPA: M56 family metallopeptidase [Caulobacteraceae bacterium]